MVVKLFIISLILSNSVSAKSLVRRLHVSSIKKVSKASTFNVTFKEMAAFYTADKSTVPCLSYSAKSNAAVKVKWNMKTLKVLKCKK